VEVTPQAAQDEAPWSEADRPDAARLTAEPVGDPNAN